jgi:chaperonin GroEL
MVNSLFGVELKNKLLRGIEKLNDSVSSTLGPGGRTVLIEDPMNGIKVTKDGVTVAKSFEKIKDPVENIGAQLVKQVSIKCAKEAGDGTTTATLLGTSIIKHGLKTLVQGVNPVDVKKGIDKATVEVVKELKAQARLISDENQIQQVATISGNNDPEIGSIIASALDSVGREGVVAIEESRTGETILDTVEGIQFDRGYKSPYFVTHNDTMQAILEKPYVFLYDGRITTAAELLPVMSVANAENKPLLIIAEDIDGEALATLVVNKARGIVKCAAVKAPEFGDKRTMVMEDIAVITGGTLLSKDKGHKLDKLNASMLSTVLGQARTVTVDKEKTTIVDGHGTSEAIEARGEEIKAQIERAVSFYEKEKLQERLGRLVGGVAVVSVGGSSEIEIKEKKDRVEDALFATRAAIEEGVLPGGGVPLYVASTKAVNGLEWGTNYSEDVGKKILLAACKEPFYKIAVNAGKEDSFVIASAILQHSDPDVTYDVKQDKVVNAYDAGLLDPLKVVRLALENAASVAGTVLTTESVVYTEEEPEKNSTSGGDMAGMY